MTACPALEGTESSRLLSPSHSHGTLMVVMVLPFQKELIHFSMSLLSSPILPPVTIPSAKDLFQFLLLLWTLPTITSILFEEQCHKLAM